jgi:hypothetical protein
MSDILIGIVGTEVVSPNLLKVYWIGCPVMRNNVLGVNAGVSKMMPVITFLPVVFRLRGDS